VVRKCSELQYGLGFPSRTPPAKGELMARNRIVVITGASSGIGRASALRFARAGDCVVLASRRGMALRELAEECRLQGAPGALAVPTDTTDEDAVQALGAAALARFGRIDVWVNSAAVSVFAPFVEVPLDDFRRVIDVNLMGYVYGARAALQVMSPQGRGVLINVSSVVGEIPQPYTAAYGMSKAAVRALGVSLRQELLLEKETNIRVVTIMPATVDTPFFRHSANYTGRQILAMPPVYSVDKVARTIVNAARLPRNEIVIGAASKAMVRQHRRHPKSLEAQMAWHVEKTHLSTHRSADITPGTLHEPDRSPGDATATGGWHGGRRLARRRFIGSSIAAAGIAWGLLRLRSRVGPSAR
jgi:short-subunit dehydrogenase